jgi:hypothetical protein
VRPVLGLALAAVLGGHLWVIDAWSLTVATDGVARPRPVPVTTRPVPAGPRLVAAPEPVLTPVPPPEPAAPPARPVLAQPHPRPRPVPAAPSVAAMVPAALAASKAPAASAEVRVEPIPQDASPEADPADSAPPSTRLHYRMKKGALSGSGQIDWLRDGSTYRMRLEARVPVFGQIFLETSEGRLDASGLAPLRHTERRLQRSERAVSFVRDQGPPRILFSAREGDEPLRPGAQDRLSWIAQLATRMASPPAGDWRPGSSLAMDVASTGGDVQRWVFTIEGREASGLWRLRREPDSPRDTRAEVWIDARQQHWPVRIQLTEPSGEPLELTLDGLQPA